jgi:hypothetical protein
MNTIGSRPSRWAAPSTISVPRTLTSRISSALRVSNEKDRGCVQDRLAALERALDCSSVGDIADGGVDVADAEWRERCLNTVG